MRFRHLARNRALTDAVLLTVASVIVWVIFSRMELFELMFESTRQHEDWDLDEIYLALFTAGLGGFVYAVRRSVDLLAEIRRRDQAERDVAWFADHDMLTKLPNRHFLSKFARRIDEDRGDGGDKALAVFSIDLNGFKKVNDLVGHGGGDELLAHVAEAVQDVATDDLVVRVGGDEFLVVAEHRASMDVRVVADKMIAAIGKPLEISGVHVQVSASVGIACYPADGETLADVIRGSDVAMFAAKKKPRHNVETYNRSMEQELAKRAELEMALRNALKNDEIVPHYQPIIDLETSKIIGFEALARWTRPNGESVPPMTFIRYAEDLGLIIELSEKLLRQACCDARQWPSDTWLSFNVSPVQLTDKMLGLRIVRILAETGLSPDRLEVEITETAIISQFETAVRVLDDLHTAGIRISLDDFGTGYSSLSQLSRFKFDKIKIDRSFVAGYNEDEKKEKVVRSMLALGHGLGIATTAEGVEDEMQLNWLKHMGCTSAQGFLFGKAVPAGDIPALLDHAAGQGMRASA